MTKQSGKKERCCKDCYTQHSAVVERLTAAELSPSDSRAPPLGEEPHSPPEPAPYKPTPRVTGERQPSEVSHTKGFFKVSSQKGTCFVLLSDNSYSRLKNRFFSFFAVSEPSNRTDDGAFDIITEEDVNGVYDSDTTSQTISLDGEQDRRPHGASNT